MKKTKEYQQCWISSRKILREKMTQATANATTATTGTVSKDMQTVKRSIHFVNEFNRRLQECLPEPEPVPEYVRVSQSRGLYPTQLPTPLPTARLYPITSRSTGGSSTSTSANTSSNVSASVSHNTSHNNSHDNSKYSVKV